MSYMSLGQMGMMIRPRIIPGTAEVIDFKAAVQAAMPPVRPVNRAGLCMNMPKEKWLPFLRKEDEIKTLYPEAYAEAASCIDIITLPNGRGHYQPMPIKDYYDKYIATKTVNIDLTPAINTVPFGTPLSFNVSGQMPVTQGGKAYSYNFMDEAGARAYGQSIVDANGTATIYQVPAPAPVQTPFQPPAPVPSPAPPSATGGQPTPPAYDISAPYVPSYGPVGGQTTAGTPTYQPPPMEYQQPTAVIVAPTSTDQGLPEQIPSTAPALPSAPATSGGFPWFLLAIPVVLIAAKS